MADSPLPAPGSLLDVDDIGISFGGLKAVQHFSIRIAARRAVRFDRPERRGQDDRFQFADRRLSNDGRADDRSTAQNLVGLKPHEVAAAGIARTFQNIRLFPGLNVLDNVRLAGQLRARHGLADTLLRTNRYRTEEDEIRRKAFELLGLFDLQDRADEPAD